MSSPLTSNAGHQLTTFQLGATARDYSTPPTIDVPVLPRPAVVPSQGFCAYCHSTEVTAHQHAWYDSQDCARCGGVTGWGLGD